VASGKEYLRCVQIQGNTEEPLLPKSIRKNKLANGKTIGYGQNTKEQSILSRVPKSVMTRIREMCRGQRFAGRKRLVISNEFPKYGPSLPAMVIDSSKLYILPLCIVCEYLSAKNQRGNALRSRV